MQKAEAWLVEHLVELRQRFEPTEAEYGRIISTVLGNQLNSIFNRQLRMERHGDTDTHADVEKER
jgi:hypothetical protein